MASGVCGRGVPGRGDRVAGANPAAAQAPKIAAAANLNFALTEIAERFAAEQGARVELVFGASGALTRQIQDGAPFEMFLAADEEFPQKLTAAGLTRDAGACMPSAGWCCSRRAARRWRSTAGSTASHAW